MPDTETLRLMLELIMALVVTPFAIVMWFLLRKLISDVTNQEKALSDFQVHIALHFVAKEDFVKSMEAQKTDFIKALDTQKEDFLHALAQQKEDFNKSFDAVFRKLDRIEDWTRAKIGNA
jgi:hypothetical protein